MSGLGQERIDDLLGVVLGGAYEVKGRIGKGGMGSVYQADHMRLPKSFAVKVLNEAVDPASELYHRFRREAEVCSRLKHDHIVEVVDFNITEDGRPYIVMELLEGEDLGTRLDRLGRLPLPAVARILGQVAEALAEAHEKGVVHRDMKPGNIFLCRKRHQDDFVKLVDFGISKIQGGGSMLTGTHALMGTPYYMSPEQTGAGDAKVDHRTDIYALGVIAYQALTGQVPFGGDNFAQLVLSIISRPPGSVTALAPELPVAVDAVIQCALAKDPAARFQSVTDFHHALSAAVSGAPASHVLGGPATPGLGGPSVVPSPTYPGSTGSPGSHPGSVSTPGSSSISAQPSTPPAGALSGSGAYSGTVSYSSAQASQPGALQPGSWPPGATPQPGALQPGSWPPGASSTLSGAAGAQDGYVLPTEQPRRSRALIFGLGAAGLAAALAVVLVLALGRGGSGQGGSDSGPTGPASPTGSMVAAGQPDPPAGSGDGSSAQGEARVVSLHPSRVVIRLADLPAEAICRLEGRVVKGNPLVLDRSDRPVTLLCEAKGRRSYTQSFTPDKDVEFKVSMEVEAGRVVSGTRTGQRSMERPMQETMAQPPARPEPARPPPEMKPPKPMANDVLID